MESGIAIAILVLFLIILMKGLLIVKQSEVIIIERLGNYNRTLEPGINFIIPIIDAPRSILWQKDGETRSSNRIDLREIILDVEEQVVITRDNVQIGIDAIMYVQITDPKRAIYEVANLPQVSGQLAQTSLRSLIGDMELDATLSSRDIINKRLKVILDEATDKWGLKVNRVEIKNIAPPKDIQASMDKQMQAERERRAVVLQAEGEKQSRIARSEGEKQEYINQAQGERQAAIERAEGEAKSIEVVVNSQALALKKISEALNGNTDLAVRYLTAINYLDKFGDFIHGDGDKVFLPYDASGTLSSLGSINEIFKNVTQIGQNG